VVNRGLKADDLVKSSGIIDKDIAKVFIIGYVIIVWRFRDHCSIDRKVT